MAPTVTPPPSPPPAVVPPPPPAPAVVSPPPPAPVAKPKPVTHAKPKPAKQAKPKLSATKQSKPSTPVASSPVPTVSSGQPVVLVFMTMLAALLLLGAAVPRQILRGPFVSLAVHRVALTAAGIAGLFGVIIGYFARGS